MNSQVKSRSQKLLKSLIIVLLILSTILTVKVLAGAFQGGYDAEKRSKNDRPISDFEDFDQGCDGKKYVWWELKDLDEFWYILCSQRHTSIPSGNYDVSATCNGCGTTLTINTKKQIHRPSLGCIGEAWTGCTHCSSGSYTITDDGLSNTMGYYSLSFPGSIANHKCNPAEAYILAESAFNYPGNHNASEVQHAWWNTWLGHIHFGGGDGNKNGLWEEAVAFQEYICELLKVSDPGQTMDWPYGHVTKEWKWETLSGNEEIVTDQGTANAAFDIKYEPIWYNADGNEEKDERYKSEPEKYKDVDHDGQLTEADKVTYAIEPNSESSTGAYYVIGPYSIEYLERNITAGDRDRTVHFSKITKMSILTNLGYSTIVGNEDGKSNDEKGSPEDKLNRKDESDPPVDSGENKVKWKMRFVSGTSGRGEGSSSDAYNNYEFPHCDEVFYILIEYVPELTVLNGIDVEFRYMNASGICDAYKGYWNKYEWETWSAVCCWWPTIPPTPKDYKGGLDIKAIEDKKDSQALVYANEAVRWYEYTDLSRNDGTPLFANITIEKELVDDAGKRILVDGEYSFNIFVDYQDGEGEKLFETLTVIVQDGYGKKTSQTITWEGEGFALVLGRDEGISKEDGYDPTSPVVGKNPTYRIEEIVPEGSTLVSMDPDPCEGTLTPFETVKLYAKNTLEPHKGKIKLKKEFTNILHDLQKQYMESQTYYFKVDISGVFQCPDQAAEDGYDSSEMYTNIEWLITLDASDNWETELPELIWYDVDNPPTYRVQELYPDQILEKYPDYAGILGIDENTEYYYKLTSIAYASGIVMETPEDSEEEIVRTVIATNEPTLKVVTLQLNKEILDEEKPEAGDIFKVHLKMNIKDGGFDINGLNNKAYNKDNPYEQEITLSGSEWKSEKITVIWYGKVAPTYTVKEIEYPIKYEFVSIRDGLKSSTKNEFTNKLTDKLQQISITILNKIRETESAKISVLKRTETESLNDKEFGFDIEVKGKFTYTGTDGTVTADPDDPTKQIFKYSGTVKANGDIDSLGGEFVWYKGDEKPTYTVTEHDLSDADLEAGIQFVSISNDNKTVTNKQRITDSFSGEKHEQVVIRMLNNKNEPTNRTGKISIDKITVGNIDYLKNVAPEDLKLKFEVELSSKNEFVYKAPDGTDTRVVNDKIKLSNSGYSGSEKIYVELTVDPNTGKTDTWTSGEISWDENSVAPTFSVREVDIPSWAKFKSWRTTTTTVSTTKIIGNVSDGITANTLTAINQVVEKYQYGSLKILKKAATSNISGQEFIFTLTVNGHFWYNDAEHKAEDEPLVIEDIKVNADDENGWSSGTFKWLYSDGNPTYTVVENLGDDEEVEEGEIPPVAPDEEEEEDPYEGVEVISISNGTQSNSDNSVSGSIPGRDDEDDTTKAVVTITAINKKEPKQVSGYIQLEKKLILDGNEFDSNRRFTFIIKLTYHDKITGADGSVTVQDREVIVPVAIKAGQKSRVVRATWWDYEDAPDYEIKEVTDDNTSVSYTEGSPSGKLKPNEVIYVKAENTLGSPHNGKLAIEKIIEYNDKLSSSDIKNLTEKFTFNVYVTGTFTYKVGDSVRFYDNETMQLKVELNMAENSTWTSEGDFTWYGDDVPSYAIEEVYLPNGIYLKSIDNASGKLSDGITKATCTNRIELREVVLLTMEMAGRVWDDTDYTAGKDADTQENGLIDEGESGIEGVRVRLYRVVTDEVGKIVAKLPGVWMCQDNNVLAGMKKTDEEYAETYTDSFGNWSFGTLSAPGFDNKEQAAAYSGKTVSYDVRFDYDGQTYEPTTFLATAGGSITNPVGNPQTYINSSTSERDKYLNDSMAYDQNSHVSSQNNIYGVEDRDTFNNKFATIEGQDPMDENGKTVGKTDGGVELHYSSTDSSSYISGDNTRKISTLDLYDDEGKLYEDYLITATTSTGGLTYPFDKNMHLASWDKKVMWYGISSEYVYSATYNYMQHVNLGLIKREAADVALEKDLTEAVVVVNGKVLKYKYNSAINFDDPDNLDLLYKQIQVADEQFEYKLGLYSSDYYYRASIYGGDAKSAMEGFYVGTLGYSSLNDIEMDVYLKYTINVYNESDTYDVEIKEIADYYDSTFSLVTSGSETARYVRTINGKEINNTIELAESPQMTIYNAAGEVAEGEEPPEPTVKVAKTGVSWSDNVETLTGSDQVEYTKMTTSALSGQKLKTGERAELTVTFKVNKAESIEPDVNLIEDEIILGDKHNVVEITKFSSYYSDTSKKKWKHSEGEVTGRIDEDSAPDNVNIEEFNAKNYYEDDTDSAPVIVISLYNSERNINGMVWEDAQTSKIKYGQTIGDGIYNSDHGDRNIPNMTTELVETISIPESTGAGATYKEYEFIWPTGDTGLDRFNGHSVEEITGFDSTIKTDKGGLYEFSAVPAGNYKVRFVYGDHDIETGNRVDELYYNGQDYKSTAYQIGFDNDQDDDCYIDNEWHDLTNNKLTATRVSDARDSEARRLWITAQSEMLSYANTNVLSTADVRHSEEEAETIYQAIDNEEEYEDKLHKELYGDYEKAKEDGSVVTGTGYYMYAETAKLNLEVENIYKINYTTETIGGETEEEASGAEVIMTVDGDANKGPVKLGNTFVYDINNVDFGLEERSQTKLNLDKQIKEIKVTTSDGNVILDAVYDIYYDLGEDDNIKALVTLNQVRSENYNQIASLNRTRSSQGYRYIMAESTILQGTTITITYQLSVFNVGEADTCNVVLKDLWTEINKDTSIESIPKLLESIRSGSGGEIAQKLSGILDELTSPYYTEEKGRLTLDKSGKYEYGRYFGNIYYQGTQGTYITEDTIEGNSNLSEKDEIMLVETMVHQMIDYVDPDVEFRDTDNVAADKSWGTTTIEYLLGEEDSLTEDRRSPEQLISPESVIIVNNATGIPETQTDEDGKLKPVTYADRAANSDEHYAFVNDEIKEFINYDSYGPDGEIIKNNVILNVDQGADPDNPDAEPADGTNPGLVRELIPYTAARSIVQAAKGIEEITSTEEAVAIMDEAKESAVAAITLDVSRYYASEEDGEDVDNLAEIIKYENTVGRRDIRAIAGNASTYELEETAPDYTYTKNLYQIAAKEPDTSATEVVTLTPPTGMDSTAKLVTQIVIIAIIVCVILIVRNSSYKEKSFSK